jgi:hypothetical protein
VVDAEGLGNLKKPDQFEPVKAVGARLVAMDLRQPPIHRWSDQAGHALQDIGVTSRGDLKLGPAPSAANAARHQDCVDASPVH